MSNSIDKFSPHNARLSEMNSNKLWAYLGYAVKLA